MPERFGCLVRGTDAAEGWRVGTRQSLNLWKVLPRSGNIVQPLSPSIG
jgi:hypothetical protein